MRIYALLLSALIACATSEAKTPDGVTVTLSSVTLADDCLSPTVPPPPPQGFAKPPTADSNEKAPAIARGSCAKPPCPSPNRKRSCEQTSMQLQLALAAGAKPTKVAIKKVELLDDKGKVLQVLTSRIPTQWDAAKGSYVEWDGALAGGKTVQASFKLTSPDWSKLGGRMTAQNRTFQLRVVVTVGGSDRTVEKTAIVPAHIEPDVVT